MKPILMKSTLGHLSHIYMWPKSEKSTTKSAYLVLISASFILIGSFLRLIISTWKKEKINVAENVENLISQIGVIYFVVFFILNRKRVMKIVSDLSDFDSFGRPPHFDVRNKELDTIGRLFCVWIYISISTNFTWPSIYRGECDEEKEICGLVVPIWLPFDFSYFPVKQLVYIWQCYCSLVTYGAASMISVAMLEFMEHLIVRIQHLKMLVAEMIEEPDPIKRQKLLVNWVQYHLYIFRIGKEMSRSFRIGLSVHIFVAGALFGLIGHTLSKNASTINAVALFSGWFASLFVACVGGQHLLDESLSVAATIYNTRWYQPDVKFQKNIISIAMRSDRPILIYAGPFTHLSFLLILTVLRTAYSYINLLNASS